MSDTSREAAMTLGELISTFYEYFMDLYDDEDIATMATAASINDLLSRPSSTDELAA